MTLVEDLMSNVVFPTRTIACLANAGPVAPRSPIMTTHCVVRTMWTPGPRIVVLNVEALIAINGILVRVTSVLPNAKT